VLLVRLSGFGKITSFHWRTCSLLKNSDNSFQRTGIDLVRSVGFFSLISNGENVTNLDFLTSSDYTFAPIPFFSDFSS
jgi:hypothetical protein